MTFGKNRFKENEYELLRFSTKKYVIVRGLFNKFISYFKKNYNIKSLISYGNRRWTYKENVYNKIFKLESITSPNYFYVKNSILYNRIKYQKHKIKEYFNKNILNKYEESLSELDNMFLNEFRIIYDCGNYKYKIDLF